MITKLFEISRKVLRVLKFKARHPSVKIVIRRPPNEAEAIKFYSQFGQDKFIFSKFSSLMANPNFPKVFVDVGCNQPIKFSNSYFFEKSMGFITIAVDPLESYKNEWQRIRPSALLHSVALSSSVGETSFFTYSNSGDNNDEDMFSSIDEQTEKAGRKAATCIKVKLDTAQNIFDSHKISRIGLISIDVEGAEFAVLSGIDFIKTEILIALIENNASSVYGDEKIRDFMTARGFYFYARIWGLDDVYLNRDGFRRLSNIH